MHTVLYVCLPRAEARNSLEARKKVSAYLTKEGFDASLRFASGYCDYFQVGGRWSGRLEWLRLRDAQPKVFDRFWNRYLRLETVAAEKRLFRATFPTYRGETLVGRERIGVYGRADDAQVIDEPLFRQLKKGFSDEVTYAWEITEPNVIFMEDPDERPKNATEAAKFWVVVMDYHS